MFIPYVDRPLDETEWRAFVAAQGFGHLIAPGAEGALPICVPSQFVFAGDEVIAHVAAANPLVGAIERDGRALLAVAGDWAFVPSAWKAIGDEDPRRGIPTTYYAAVQLSGPATVVEDTAELAALLRRQLAALQPDVEIDDPETTHRAKLAAIRGVVLHVEDVIAKFKFGGNVDEAHRRAVIARLDARHALGDQAASYHARRRTAGARGPSAFTRPSAPEESIGRS
jgi:transcriptional regulator